jgi:lipopolysaccharide transport system ATP-binding protein
MSDIAIKVEGIGKEYKIGRKKSGDLRESFTHFLNLFSQSPALKPQSLNPQPSKTFWALKDISFEVKQGEAVGIIGRNGAGKSTLLKVLSRITRPTTGRFEINGRVSSLLEVGTGFHPELTGQENIYLNGTILGMRRAEIKDKFDEIIAFSGVEEFIDTPVKHYSSGMKVRLAFSVAAHLEPEILIIDEVLAVGDAEFQKKCLGKMEDVTGEGRTVLFVSHNMGAVRQLCQSGILLQRGVIIMSDIVTNTIKAYQEQTNQAIKNNLLFREDRIGNNQIRFKNIYITNNDGQIVNCFYSGEDGCFVFEIENYLITGSNKTQIDIGIMSILDEKVTWLSSSVSETDILVTGRKTRAYKLCINAINLSPGTYKITVFCKIGDEIADWVSNAYQFVVEDNNFYGTGKINPPNWGYALFKHNFKALLND